ncbi:MAG: hypothetical protein ACP5I3_10715 [Thermoproteus sp.]
MKAYVRYFTPAFASADPMLTTYLPADALVRVPEYPGVPGDGDYGEPPFLASEMGVTIDRLPEIGKNSVVFLESKLPKFLVFNADCFKRGEFNTATFRLAYMVDTALDCGASQSVVVGLVKKKNIVYSLPADPNYAAYLYLDLLKFKPKILPAFMRPYDAAVALMFALSNVYGLDKLTYSCLLIKLYEPERVAADSGELALLALMCGARKACAQTPGAVDRSLLEALGVGRCEGGEDARIQLSGPPDYDGRELLIYFGRIGPFLHQNYEKYYAPGGVSVVLHRPSDLHVPDCPCGKKDEKSSGQRRA